MKTESGNLSTGSDDEAKGSEELNSSSSSSHTTINEGPFGDPMTNIEQPSPIRPFVWEEDPEEIFNSLQRQSSFFEDNRKDTFAESSPLPRRESYYRRRREISHQLNLSEMSDFSCGSLEGYGGGGGDASFRKDLQDSATIESLQYQINRLTDANNRLISQVTQSEDLYQQALLENEDLRKSILSLKSNFEKAKESERLSDEMNQSLQEKEETGVQLRRINTNLQKESAAKELQLEELTTALLTKEDELSKAHQNEAKYLSELKTKSSELDKLIQSKLLLEDQLKMKLGQVEELRNLVEEQDRSKDVLRNEKLALEERLSDAMLELNRYRQGAAPTEPLSPIISKSAFLRRTSQAPIFHSTPCLYGPAASSLCNEITTELSPQSDYPNPFCGKFSRFEPSTEDDVSTPTKPPVTRSLLNELKKDQSKNSSSLTKDVEEFHKDFDDTSCQHKNNFFEFIRKSFATYESKISDLKKELEQYERGSAVAVPSSPPPRMPALLSPIPENIKVVAILIFSASQLPPSLFLLSSSWLPTLNNNLPVNRTNHQDCIASYSQSEPLDLGKTNDSPPSKVNAADVISLDSEYFSCPNIACHLVPMDHLTPNFRSRSGSFLSAIDHSVSEGDTPVQDGGTKSALVSPSPSVSGKLSILPEEEVASRRCSLDCQELPPQVHRRWLPRQANSEEVYPVPPPPYVSCYHRLTAQYSLDADRSHHPPPSARFQAPEITVQVESNPAVPVVVTTPTANSNNNLLMPPESLPPDSVKPFPSLSDDLLRKMGLHKDKPLSSEEPSEQEIEEKRDREVGGNSRPALEEEPRPLSKSTPLPISPVAPRKREATVNPGHELKEAGKSTRPAWNSSSNWRLVFGFGLALLVLWLVVLQRAYLHPLRSVSVVEVMEDLFQPFLELRHFKPPPV